VQEAELFVDYLTSPDSAYGVLLNWQERVYSTKLEV
jgi:hypothetical protein